MAETITYQASGIDDDTFHTGSVVVPCPVSRQLGAQLAQADAEAAIGDCDSDVTGHVTAEGHNIGVWESFDEECGAVDEDQARLGVTDWAKSVVIAQMSTWQTGPEGLEYFDRNGPTTLQRLVAEAEANGWQVPDPITGDEAVSILDRFAPTHQASTDEADGW